MKSRADRAVKRTMILAVLLLWGVFASGAFAVEGKNERTLETIMEAYDSLVKQGMDGVERVLKLTKREKSQVEEVWDDLNERFISVFSKIGHFEFDSLQKREKNESKANRAAEWASSMTLLIHDLQPVGEVVAWQRQVNLDIFRMEFDIVHAPNVIAGYTDWMKRIGGVEDIARDLKAGKLSSAELKKYEEELRRIRAAAENISNSLVRQVAGLNEQLKMKKEMDKRIEKILENWKNMKARHPNVAGELSDGPIAWVPLAKKHWQNLEKTREDFDKVYGPFREGKILQDFPTFRDYKYEDLAKPVIALQLDLKTVLAAALQKDKSAEELRKELAKDEELSKEEHERVFKLNEEFSRAKFYVLELADARVYGADVKRNLMLMTGRYHPDFYDPSKYPKEHEIYKKAVEDYALYEANRHPKQVEAQKNLEEFKAGMKKNDEEIKKIQLEHKKRKKSLGLAPDYWCLI